MRKIFPENNYTELVGKDSDIVKKEDLLPVTELLNQTVQALSVLQTQFNEYKDQISDNLNTNAITAITAAITTLEATEAALTSASIGQLSVSGLSQLVEMTANIATIANAVISTLTATNGNISNLSSTAATIGTLTATTALIENWSISNLSVETITASDKITSKDLETETLEVTDDASVAGDLSVTGDIDADGITVGDIDAELLDADEIKAENIVWKGSVVLNDLNTFYLEIPHFENGAYYLQLKKDNNDNFATIEIFNSVDNYFIRWSATLGNIEEVYKYNYDENSKLYIKFHNDGSRLTATYATTSATENVAGPASYVTLPIEPTVTYPITYKDGSKFFKVIDLYNQGSTVGTLSQTTTTDIAAATTNVAYDTTEDRQITVYKPNQSLNTTDEVEFDEVHTTFLDVRDFGVRNFKATELQTLSTLDLTDYDDGAVIVVRDSSTAASPQDSTAYIKKTVNGTPVLYKILVAMNMPASISNKPLIWNSLTGAIEEATNLTVSGTLSAGNTTITGDISASGDATIGGDIAATGDITGNDITASGDISGTNATLSGDATITGDLSAGDITATHVTADETTTDNATVNNDLHIMNDAIVEGDLVVRGSTITSDVENVQSNGDFIVLRANSPQALATGDYAGIVIHNYNLSGKDLLIVTDNSGTVRIATQSTEAISPLANVWLVDMEYFYGNTNFSQATHLNENYPVTSYNEVHTDYEAYRVATNVSGTGHLFYDPNAATPTYYSNITYSNGAFTFSGPISWTPSVSDISHEVHFYTTISFLEPQASNMEPILTRNEASNMTDSSLIIWDGTNEKAATISAPMQNNTYLKASIDSQTGAISYSWGEGGGVGVAFVGTRAQYNTAKLIPQGQTGYIPSGAMVVITDENDNVYGDNQ